MTIIITRFAQETTASYYKYIIYIRYDMYAYSIRDNVCRPVGFRRGFTGKNVDVMRRIRDPTPRGIYIKHATRRIFYVPR